MTTEQFIYWLQGFAELENSCPNQEQWELIKANLALCFNQLAPKQNQEKVEIPKYYYYYDLDYKEKVYTNQTIMPWEKYPEKYPIFKQQPNIIKY